MFNRQRMFVAILLIFPIVFSALAQKHAFTIEDLYRIRSVGDSQISPDGENILFGRSALAEIPYGQGKIILIGFPVYYRGQSYATFRLLFNAIYYGKARRQYLE